MKKGNGYNAKISDEHISKINNREEFEINMDVFEYTWGNKVVTGEEKSQKPSMVVFRNSALALEMLDKHIRKNGNIVIHCDVDVDGIGTGYIIGKFIQSKTGKRPLYIINKDKQHGIQQKHVDYFKNIDIDLMIIVDSSSNELDIIKQFKCDVLVIDHHELNHNELVGNTAEGNHKYVIVNNTIGNDEVNSIKCWISRYNPESREDFEVFPGDDRMSCGLVVYELLRLYCEAIGPRMLLENLKLYQWAGVTLFTDAILLNTPRNQWYIENTVCSMDTEITLYSMLKRLNNFKELLDKTSINFTVAPVINKAIRAGHSGDALRVVVSNPEGIIDLMQYKEAQDEALEIGISDYVASDTYVLRDMSTTSVHKNYNGVIASRLCGDLNKNCIVYRITDEIAEGSFRGRMSNVDYRKVFNQYNSESSADGHKAAFGFKCNVKDIDGIMRSLTSIESSMSDKYLLTAGKINEKSPGKFPIYDIEEFKRQGGIWKLGIGNSRVNSDEQILLTVSAEDAVLFEQRGRLYIYTILGLKCKAFEPITKPVVNIYVEYSKQIECYIRQ